MRNIGRKNDQKLRKWQFNELLQIIYCAKEEKEVEAVLGTLLMRSEKENISQRASMLAMFVDGRTFEDVKQASGASSSTVVRAFDQYLKNGQYNKRFKKVVECANAVKKREEKRKRAQINMSRRSSLGLSVKAELREARRSQAHTSAAREKRKGEECR